MEENETSSVSPSLPPQLLLILLLIVATLGASSPTAAKFALESLGPFTLLSLRFFFGLLILLPFGFLKKKINLSDIKKGIPLGLIGALNPILLFIALQFTNASFSPLIYGGVPALSALYMFIFHNEKQSLQTILGILMGLSGVGFVVLQSSSIEGASLFGNGLIFLASIAFAGFGIISQKVQSKQKLSVISVTITFALVSLLVSIPFAMYELFIVGLKAPVAIHHIASAVYLGIFNTAIFYLLYQYVIKHSTAVAASVMVYIQPIVGVALAVFLLDEKITVSFIIGGVLAIVGAQLAAHSKSEKSKQ